MNKKDFQLLAHKVHQRTASDEEIALYNYYYDQFQAQEDEDWESVRMKSKEDIEQELFNRIQSGMQEKKLPVRSSIKPALLKVAAILVIASVSIVLYNQYIKKESVPSNVTASLNDIDVLPGSNKAILTLNGGKQIMLDDMDNGAVINQGDLVITKSADGKVTYDLSQIDHNDNKIAYHTISTPKGGKFTIVLPDKSVVILNSESSIVFPTQFSDKERNVTLTGEAYFDIEADKDRPFKLKVNNINIQVLGTQFNVNAYADNNAIKTSLFEGSVKISNKKHSNILKPSQKAIIQTAESEIKIEEFNGDMDIAWKSDLFVFENEPIADIMKKISRWYNVEIVYEGEMPEQYFGGRYSMKNTLSELLKSIELTGTIHFKVEGRRITVMN